MKTSEKLTKIAKLTASTAVDTIIGCAEYTAIAAPLAIGITATANKLVTGAFDIKGSVVTVAKNAATAISAITIVNTAIAAATATTNAIKNSGEFADDEQQGEPVEEFDDWDEEEA